MRLLALTAVLIFCAVPPLPAQDADPYQQGQQAFAGGDYAKAAALFAAASGATHSDALLLEGKSLANLGKFSQADEVLHRYVTLHPNSADGIYMLGFVLHRENKPADSLRAYTQAAALSTPQADDLRIVGLDYVLLNDFPDAIRWLKKATEFDANNQQAWYSLGRCYYSQNRFEEAERALNESLRLNPKDAKTVTNLALTYEMENRIDDAERAYRTSIQMADADPHSDEWPYLNYASFLLEHDRAAAALPLLRRTVAIAPRCADCHAKLGKALAATGSPKESIAELTDAITLSPDDPKLHYALGHVYQSLGMTDQAKAELAISAKLYGTRDAVGPQ
ncbi:MAG TPA: tetratricopeptide repeat protein [Acidobacteriaceae bacterium]|nr:tetratricopeptide repeat protein [Acidobacteriaceae bacterium]